jgi:hypothetical protein
MSHSRKRRTRGKALLVFGKGNAKLKDVYTFSLPAGWTCPGAKGCLAKADPTTGKITDGPDADIRCFSASQEALYPSVRKARWHNFNLLRGLTLGAMVYLILLSLPKKAREVRVHVAGDFFRQDYFDAWVEVARRRPDILFYAYTKSLPMWLRRAGTLPANFVLTASKGGRWDARIEEYSLRQAVVVLSEAEARERGLELDHNDSHAMSAEGGDFALLIHGPQRAGTPAAKAITALRAQGDYGYGAKADQRREARRVALPMAG